MIEIKVTGNTAEEIKENMMKMARFFDVAITAGDVQLKPEKEVKDAKNETTTASKPIAEESATPSGEEQQGEEDTGDAEINSCDEANKGEEDTVTLEEVRAKGTALARAGKRDLVKQVLEAAGAEKLSDVPVNKLGYVMSCFDKEEVL